MANPDLRFFGKAREAYPDAIIATGRSIPDQQRSRLLCFMALDCRAERIGGRRRHQYVDWRDSQGRSAQNLSRAYGVDGLAFGPDTCSPFDSRY